MGNWRNRPPRRFFYRQDRTPRTPSYDPEPPSPSHSRLAEDGVPPWEKKFCSLIGSVPWRKVVDAKKFMYCHSNVLNWDDSAGEEAFQNAKKRFWAEINGLPCDICPPHPDMYIDDIDWNPDIDPELLKELERDFFAPVEGEQDGMVGRKNKKRRNFVSVPVEGFNLNPGDVKNPWECNNNVQSNADLKDKAQGCSQWDTNMIDSNNLNNDDNPWECNIPQESEAVKGSTWGHCSNNVSGWNQSGNHVSQQNGWNNSGNPWESRFQGIGSVKNKERDNFGHSSWSYNQQESRKLNNGSNSWESNFIQASGTTKDRPWRDSGGNAWGWKQWDNYDTEPKSLESRKLGGGWGAWNEGCQKGEGTHQYNWIQKHKV